MAITISVAFAQPNHLRYFMTTTSDATDTGVITTTGAATPDIKTDLVAGGNQGPLLALAKVISQGYGTFASGVQTQAKARALWLSDRSGANPASGTTGVQSRVPTATCRLTARGGSAAAWLVDAGIDGSGNPVLNVTSIASAAVGVPAECYLDIFVRDTIGG